MKMTASLVLAILVVLYGGSKVYSIYTFDDHNKVSLSQFPAIINDSQNTLQSNSYTTALRQHNSLKVQLAMEEYNVNTSSEIQTVQKDNELFVLLSDANTQKVDYVKSPIMQKISNFWKCDIDNEYICTPLGCRAINSPLWLVIDFSEKLYKRCDDSECDESAMMVSSNKNYTTISLPLEGISVRISNSDSVFSGADSQGDTVISIFGNCMPSLPINKAVEATGSEILISTNLRNE